MITLIGAYITVEEKVYTPTGIVTLRSRIEGPFASLAQARRIADLAAGSHKSAHVVICL